MHAFIKLYFYHYIQRQQYKCVVFYCDSFQIPRSAPDDLLKVERGVIIIKFW